MATIIKKQPSNVKTIPDVLWLSVSEILMIIPPTKPVITPKMKIVWYILISPFWFYSYHYGKL